MGADPDAAVALLERILGEVLELRARVDALHAGRQGLDAGRRKAIREAQGRAAYVRTLVVEAAAADLQAGGRERGRAKRIALTLSGRASESTIRKILRGLSSARDSSAQDRGKGD